MLRIAICDDDINFCYKLESIILDYMDSISELAEVMVYFSGERLLQEMRNSVGFDIIFLDIELKQINGVQVGIAIRKELNLFFPQIIYVTSFESYAVQLFQNQPFGFVTKPVNEEKIRDIIKEYKRQFDNANVYYEFTTGKNICKVAVKDIYYLNSIARKLVIHTREDEFETYKKLDDFYKLPISKYFIRIHKSFAVNQLHISVYHYDRIKLSNGEELSISRNYRKEVRKELIKL